MGSAQSYISSEAAMTTLVVVGAIGLGYTQIGRGSTTVRNSTDATPKSDKGKKKRAKPGVVFSGEFSDKGNDKSQQPITTSPILNPLPGQFEPATSPDSHLSDVAATSSSLSKAKKSKKKKAKALVTTDPIVREVASSSADYSSEISNKSKTKTLKRQQQPQSSSPMTKLPESTASIDTDGSWTRVGSVRRQTPLSKKSAASFDATTSDADTGLTPQTGDSSPVAERGTGTEGEESSSFLLDIGTQESSENPRKTLAEKLLPKPRRTAVDDMLETPDYPTLARVMRVQPLPDEKPASGFSWGDYEDVRVTTDGGENDADGEDDGWGVVRTRRQRVDRASSSTFTTSSHHQTQKASETMTKRQRQNAQKRDDLKAAKAAAESHRLAVLTNHKQELERIRMLEQHGGKSGGKTPSGGMKAYVDERGKLVWD